MDLNDGDIKLCSMFVCNMLTGFLRVFPRNSIQKFCVEISKKKKIDEFYEIKVNYKVEFSIEKYIGVRH